MLSLASCSLEKRTNTAAKKFMTKGVFTTYNDPSINESSVSESKETHELFLRWRKLATKRDAKELKQHERDSVREVKAYKLLEQSENEIIKLFREHRVKSKHNDFLWKKAEAKMARREKNWQKIQEKNFNKSISF